MKFICSIACLEATRFRHGAIIVEVDDEIQSDKACYTVAWAKAYQIARKIWPNGAKYDVVLRNDLAPVEPETAIIIPK